MKRLSVSNAVNPFGITILPLSREWSVRRLIGACALKATHT
jgi:hypothetical protein